MNFLVCFLLGGYGDFSRGGYDASLLGMPLDPLPKLF